MSNSYLPEDLLVLVLIRLPPKSLYRFKSVSKSWDLLISSSEFIRSHLQYQSSIQKKPNRLLCKNVSCGSKGQFSGLETRLAEYSINGRDLENLELGCKIQRIYNPYERYALGMSSMFVGSCNGLLCQILYHGNNLFKLSIYGEYEISLCNPLTKSSWVLPKSPLFLKYGRRIRRVVSYGFGYDDVHDTYKVFLVSAPPHDEYEERHGSQPDAKYEYKVYSLRTDKWIIVSSDPDFHDYFIDCPGWNLDGVLVNCALHWIIRNPYGPNENKKKNYILAFDLRVDQLNILPLPEAAEECYSMSLSVLNGCLLLSDGEIKYEPEATFDMWVMKDYGLKDSWTMIRVSNSSHDLCYMTLVALVEDNHHHKRKLIYHDHRRRNCSGTVLLSYDIESHQVVEFPTPPSRSFHSSKQLHFVGSLVQPHPPSSFGDNKIYTRLNKTTAPPNPRKKLRTSSESTSKFRLEEE